MPARTSNLWSAAEEMPGGKVAGLLVIRFDTVSSHIFVIAIDEDQGNTKGTQAGQGGL